jgi:hypothetical protein
MTTGRVMSTIHAGDIELTNHRAGTAGHQIKMGHELHIYITEAIAKQWIETLTPIATTEESK